ncbi:hypothetical protein D3C87_1327930 [compost metagenome]
MNEHRCIAGREQLEQRWQQRRQQVRKLPVDLQHHVSRALSLWIISEHGGNPWVGTNITKHLQVELRDSRIGYAARVTLTLCGAA